MKNLQLLSHVLLATTILTAVATPAMSQTAVPMLINYQAELRDPRTGDVVADGSYDMLIRIYDVESGGSALWQGTYTAANGNPVEVANGIFSVILGSGTGNALAASVFSGPDRWLEMQVGAEMLSPRQRITAVPYSMVSESAQDADTVDGMEGADLEESAEIDADVVAHATIANVHHDRYADAEAVAAMGAKAHTNPLHHDKTTSFGELTDSASDAQITATIARDTEVDSKITDHAAVADAHHAKTTSFAELTDTATDAQIPDSITVNYATSAGDADTVDGMQGADLEESAEIDADITAHAGIADAHHARYADSEAVTAMGANSDTNPLNHDKTTSLPWGSITSIPAGFADGVDNDSGGARWSLTGNSGTSPAANFLGTTDNQPLEVRVNNARALRLEPNPTSPNVIGGHSLNGVTDGAAGATIGGGGETGLENRVSDSFGTVGGGYSNQAGDNAGTTSDANVATVGGGHSNVAGAFSATVAGGAVNTANAAWAVIGGGNWNNVTDENGTVAGGNNNQAGDNAGTTGDATCATVGGGQDNAASGSYATVGGGALNTASGADATVGGGWLHSASGGGATVGGGHQNIANGPGATVGGGASNTATGQYSFAAGQRAKAYHLGSFVWADSQDADIASTKANEVTFRCLGGVRFTSGVAGADQTVLWNPGDSLWSFTSDRNLKENFVEVDAREVLDKLSALPIAEWNFKGYSQRHVGPVAQDFHA
ncbi:tail fiber domain-containing protein, partial [bacterium]|nr:tail fiber domain-containing protein [bacterium]